MTRVIRGFVGIVAVWATVGAIIGGIAMLRMAWWTVGMPLSEVPFSWILRSAVVVATIGAVLGMVGAITIRFVLRPSRGTMSFIATGLVATGLTFVAGSVISLIIAGGNGLGVVGMFAAWTGIGTSAMLRIADAHQRRVDPNDWVASLRP